MSVDPHTEQKLLELIYDLLPDAEAAELRSRIASDPALAEAYAQAQTAAGLFAEAARLQAPKLALTALKAAAASPAAAGTSLLPAAPSPMSVGAPATAGPRKPVDSFHRARTKWAHLIVAAAASLLLAISLGGYWYHRGQLAEIAAEHLRMVVVGPAVVQAGAPAEFHLQTTSVTGDPMTAQVELTLYSGEGKRLWAHHQKCDDDGRLTVGIPADVKLPSRARLEVLAVHRDKFERFDTPLTVAPTQYLTRLWTDRSEYRPGDVVHCRAVTMSRCLQTPERPFPVRFELRDGTGKLVCETPLESMTTRGVAADALRLATSLPPGQYVLTARSAEGPVVSGNKRLNVVAGDATSVDPAWQKPSPPDLQSPPPAATVAASAPAVSQPTAPGQTSSAAQPGAPSELPPGKVKDEASAPQIVVEFFPEGGALAPGVENRVYLTAATADGKPVRTAGQIVDSANNRLADVRTGDHGLGRFSITPQLGQQYRLKIDKPQQPDTHIALPPAVEEQKAAISLAQGVLDAGSPLEFTVRTSEPGLPLVAAAYCGELLIAQQPIVADGQEAAALVVVPLPSQASGVIRLVLFDFSTAPPRPVAERLAYRRPSRWLDVQLAGLRKHYKPGETVEITVQTTNEKGQRVPAVVGISAVAERGPGSGMPSAGGSSDRFQSLLTELLIGAGLPDGKELTAVDRLLAESPADRETLELLLGAQPAVYLKTAAALAQAAQQPAGKEVQEKEPATGLRPLPGDLVARNTALCQPPALYDNLKRLHEQYDARLRQYQAHRTRLLNTLTTASFFGGLGLVLLVAMLGVLRIVSGWHLWAPAVGVTVCCLIIGAVLIDPSRLRPGGDGLVAFASYQPPTGEKAVKENGRGEAKADQPGDSEQERSGQAAALNTTREHDNLVDGLGKTATTQKQQPAPADRAQSKPQEFGKPADNVARRTQAMRPQRVGEERQDAAGQPSAGEGPSEPKMFARRAVDKAAESLPVEETVFWHPLLDTGAEGRTTIAFRLPDRPAVVRLRIDAHCQGRLGGAELEIVVSAPSDPADARGDGPK